MIFANILLNVNTNCDRMFVKGGKRSEKNVSFRKKI